MFNISFDSPNRFYTLYYDESNNHRKFYINEGKNSYNVDNDPSRKHAAATNFMLGGVAHKGNACTANASELIKSLMLQKSAKELKFGQVATGSFELVLKSARLKMILRWLLDSDLYIHYFNLNMEYWAFIDIIDDCVQHCLEQGKLVFYSPAHYREYLDFHKDALYRVIKADRGTFLGMVKSFSYPFIEGAEQAFIKALHSLVTDYTGGLFSQQLRPEQGELAPFLSLAELLVNSSDIEDMTLTLNQEEGVLVDGFSVFYQHRGMMFRNSDHIFDDEFSVEEEISLMNRHGPQPSFKCKFVNSDDSPLTQISDVVAGLFAKYFDFIERNKLDDLYEMKARFTPLQLEALDLMKALVDKSHGECEYLLHYVMTASEHQKHRLFLFPGEA